MPSSSVRAFTDPEEFATAVGQGSYRLTVTQRGKFAANITRIDLHHLLMQRFSENLPRTVYTNTGSGRATFVFLTQPGPAKRNGIEVRPGEISRQAQADSYSHVSGGPHSLGTVSLPIEDILSIGASVVDGDLSPPAHTQVITPAREAVARLLRLHEAAGHLATDAPAVLANIEAARGLEQALIGALMDCLARGEARHDGRALRQHTAIMRRFHNFIEQHPDEPLYIPDLCREVGASERILRACCREHLGIGPKHYLVLRRMHLFRRALGESSPTDTTVTQIATRYGFWQFGRLAVEYRALFGETPSVTLARQ